MISPLLSSNAKIAFRSGFLLCPFTMSHSCAINSRFFLFFHLFCSPFSMDLLSHALRWSHMDPTISVWQLRGHHIVCNHSSHSFTALFANSTSFSPTAAAVASGVHVPCVCLVHVANIIYLPRTLHRGLVVRFAITQT